MRKYAILIFTAMFMLCACSQNSSTKDGNDVQKNDDKVEAFEEDDPVDDVSDIMNSIVGHYESDNEDTIDISLDSAGNPIVEIYIVRLASYDPIIGEYSDGNIYFYAEPENVKGHIELGTADEKINLIFDEGWNYWDLGMPLEFTERKLLSEEEFRSLICGSYTSDGDDTVDIYAMPDGSYDLDIYVVRLANFDELTGEFVWQSIVFKGSSTGGNTVIGSVKFAKDDYDTILVNFSDGFAYMGPDEILTLYRNK